ncbi:transmembrane protein 100-like [Sinocyclocheilus anshuiensis]|uniref:transmembrane protein 100-like n=1 Tax=Sinocyclocheilus anshuiensis TaxID=1608454 RepID=UPI0007B8DFFC|nr:PREDICTED: transmembrane protein 100-like [Sinocyclocheilus anshuiensis]
MCCCYKQGRRTKCSGARNTSQPERGSKCSLLTEPAEGGTATRKRISGDTQRVSEMGCSSGRLPCQPPASMQLATLDPECSLARDGTPSMAVPKAPEDLSTLERLAQATGGTEKSWYRCVFPFGVISLVIGMAGTGVTFTFNTLPQTKVVSLVLLVTGFVMLLIAAACWKVHRSRKREKKEGGIFSSEQCTL